MMAMGKMIRKTAPLFFQEGQVTCLSLLWSTIMAWSGVKVDPSIDCLFSPRQSVQVALVPAP